MLEGSGTRRYGEGRPCRWDDLLDPHVVDRTIDDGMTVSEAENLTDAGDLDSDGLATPLGQCRVGEDRLDRHGGVIDCREQGVKSTWVTLTCQRLGHALAILYRLYSTVSCVVSVREYMAEVCFNPAQGGIKDRGKSPVLYACCRMREIWRGFLERSLIEEDRAQRLRCFLDVRLALAIAAMRCACPLDVSGGISSTVKGRFLPETGQMLLPGHVTKICV